ncbi:GGDEF domain-containing protein [Permianibacter sp. IMCC34836]|uniref:GGDEF domain-containing protein n=1 Tax=Permianibacter fluminis TaxID=2738515 RepID=UPI001551EE94|nr:GGDEF domain-containing protein [Permianibacter fluminis]NQD36168.1 GGDEF domain-containing protein [Permianibacter fluminis]
MSTQRLRLDAQHRELLLKQVYRLTLVLLLIGLVVALLYFQAGIIGSIVAGLLVVGVGDLARQRGQHRLARSLLLNFLLIFITALALMGEGSNDGALFLVFPVTVFAGLMLSRKHYWRYSLSLFAAAVFVGYAESRGYVVPVSGALPAVQLWTDLFIMLVAFAANTMLIDFALNGVGSFLLKVRDELEQETLNWHKAAMTDALTGLLNRRGFMEHAEWQLHRARLDSAQIAVLMFDLDHFKKINDSHGHAVGDEVLQEMGRRLRNHLRANDASGRMGGEEFCALLNGVSARDAELIASRFCQSLAQTPMVTTAGHLAMTVSIGVYTGRAGDLNLQAMIQRADHALYVAKSGGRNQVVNAENASSPDFRRSGSL